MPNWMHYVNWWWMGVWMAFWFFLIGAIGYGAALLAWRDSDDRAESHRPKSA